MKKLAVLSLAVLALGALAACGGGSDAAADPKFQDAAPTYDKAALQIDDSDASAPSSADPTGTDQQALSDDPCHPHLFTRTHEIVARLNRHTFKVLRRIQDAISDHPRLKDGQEHIWDRLDAAGIQHKLTITKTSSGFTIELDLAAKGSTTFVKVFSGDETTTSTTTGTNTVVEKKGTMSFDFDALKSVIPTERASGQIDVEFDLVRDPSKPGRHVKKTLTINLTSFLPEEGDPHGPRTGSYTHVGEPGVGGSLQFADSLILLCPSNPTGKVADTQTVARWYRAADGSIHGRADAKATGGQIPAGDTFIGVSCHQGATASAPDAAYWMMKLEDSTGATVQGSSKETTDASAPACDAVFGAVPSLTDDKTDFDFTKAVTFPNEW